MEDVVTALQLHGVLERDLSQLSGGELQRLAIAITCLKEVDVYMFDEPTSFLDVSQVLLLWQSVLLL